MLFYNEVGINIFIHDKLV